MQLRYTKATFTSLWVLAVVVAALLSNLTSTSHWIILAALLAIPPAILWWLWNPPVPSMSDNIRKALRD
jgi:hypothetical protein